MATGEPLNPTRHDVLVLGGGPAGAAAALDLARRGRDVAVLEKTAFPRFHVGESLIPADTDVFARLGLTERLAALPRVHKDGVEFVTGDAAFGSRIKFADGLNPRGAATHSFNTARAGFDAALLDAAIDAGAGHYDDAKVTAIDRLADGDVRLQTARGPFAAQWLIDASGQAAVVGRHRKQRRHFADAALKKVAFFGHVTGVDRDNALGEHEISMVLAEEGWFWMIPVDDERVSVGMVLDADVAKRVQREQQVPNHRMLRWGIARCPLIAGRCQHATLPERNHTASDFSYTCAPYAGPGHFLVGDAATFLDPVFSTGIFLGLEGGLNAAERVDRLLDGTARPTAERRAYERDVRRTTRPFFKLIRAFYDPAFRDLFLDGTGPLAMHRAAITLLAGHVAPRPRFAVRWRMALLHACVALQRRGLPLTDRKPVHSLRDATPAELPRSVAPVASVVPTREPVAV